MIRRFFRKILSFFSISGDKTNVFPETQQKFTKDEFDDFNHSEAIELSEELIFEKEEKTILEDVPQDKREDHINSKQEYEILKLEESGAPVQALQNDQVAQDTRLPATTTGNIYGPTFPNSPG